jgi:hypothetical protein
MAAVFLVIIAWLYVALMMAVAEATSPVGTVLGAIFTFLIYGVGPLALVVYLMARPKRRNDGSGEPDRSGETPADPVAPVRKEP